jgi:FkbM family methyltransferase
MDLAENWNNGDEQTNGEAWLIQQVAAELRMVFDVGANVGRWTSMLAEANPRCVVHAFEPSPSTFRNLAARFSGSAQVKVWQAGLGDAEGSCQFNDYGENSVLSSFASRRKSIGMEPERLIEVPIRTLDGFCAQEKITGVDLVKIDTEGYEMAVLRGMQSALQSRSVALIQFEYGGTWLDAGETLADANDLLLGHGYQLYKLRPASLEKVAYDCRRYECFKYANFVAAAPGEVLQRWRLPVCAT